jgi:hypothetical protein
VRGAPGRVAAQEGVFIPAADTDQYAQQRDYAGSGRARGAGRLRGRALALVGELARAPRRALGAHRPPRALRHDQLWRLVSLMVDHDDAHLEQIRAVLGLPS